MEARPSRYSLMLLTVGLGIGGTEGQILELASKLDRRRFAVTVCVLKGDGAIAQELRDRGVRVMTLNGKGAWDIRVLYRLFKVIRAERPDVIHAFLFWANLASRLVGRILQVPVLISSYRELLGCRTWPRRAADRLTARWAHAMTCCSEAVRQLTIEAVGGEAHKYVTIHNGIDPDRFTIRQGLTRSDLGLQEGLPVIGTVCRLSEPEKGLAVLLQAMTQLVGPSGGPLCQLVIVGEGPSYGQLRALSEKLSLSHWVVFAGVRRDVAELLPLMDIFVLPSLSEGFGIAIVEAMAAGRPVVATTVGGIPEIVRHGETGLLVPPGDPGSLAWAVRQLLDHPDRAATMGALGRQRARETFSIASVVKRHEDLYDRLLARHAASVSAYRRVLGPSW